VKERWPGREERLHPARAYTTVGVARANSADGVAPGPASPAGKAEDAAFLVLIDGTPLLTPAQNSLAVPTAPLAEAIAAEWAAQARRIDPRTMPLTTLANAAIDGARGREDAVRAAIVAYGTCDLLCYRAEAPEALVRRQRAAWDGVLAWAAETLGVRLRAGAGLMPLSQPQRAAGAIAAQLSPLDCFALTALHSITSLTGSAVLALALARGRLTAEAAWAAAHVDEAYQVSQWGEDLEAKRRQQRRYDEMLAASRMLELLEPPHT
jgi:chaperone required for assembly of F1-ATPase